MGRVPSPCALVPELMCSQAWLFRRLESSGARRLFAYREPVCCRERAGAIMTDWCLKEP
jgi:hypothetical protein